jgi:hypothetical protein
VVAVVLAVGVLAAVAASVVAAAFHMCVYMMIEQQTPAEAAVAHRAVMHPCTLDSVSLSFRIEAVTTTAAPCCRSKLHKSKGLPLPQVLAACNMLLSLDVLHRTRRGHSNTFLCTYTYIKTECQQFLRWLALCSFAAAAYCNMHILRMLMCSIIR